LLRNEEKGWPPAKKIHGFSAHPVENIVEYFWQLAARIPIFPLANLGTILIEKTSPYLSDRNPIRIWSCPQAARERRTAPALGLSHNLP
jgi:hypothetical protein